MLTSTCTHPTNNTPVMHMHARICFSTYWTHELMLVIMNSFLSARFLSSFSSGFHHHSYSSFFDQIPGIRHIPYFHHRRQPHSPAALQKSKALPDTPVWFQNPVMCYNWALSRMLSLPIYLCHSAHVRVWEKGSGWLSRAVIRFLSQSFLVVSSAYNTQTQTHISDVGLNYEGQRGKAGGFTWSERLKKGREKVIEANRESVSRGERAWENEKEWKEKGE